MESDDLPTFDPNIDYRKILPIHQKRTIAFINHFIMSTVSFLNDFAQTCEARLMDFEYKLQKVEASLLILESQLSSIADLDDVETNSPAKQLPDSVKSTDADVSSNMTSEGNGSIEPVNTDLDTSKPQDRDSPDVAIVNADGPKASEDVRFSKFFKMIQFGVPPQAVKLKMQSEGIDPNILDKPNEVIPGSSLVESNTSEPSSDSD